MKILVKNAFLTVLIHHLFKIKNFVINFIIRTSPDIELGTGNVGKPENNAYLL